MCLSLSLFPFFFNVAATPEIFTLSLHDALPILVIIVLLRRSILLDNHGQMRRLALAVLIAAFCFLLSAFGFFYQDRKSTRLNSSHTVISYAVFCLKKKISYYTGGSFKLDTVTTT